LTYTLDYNEPLPRVIARLEDEHKKLEPKLNQIEQQSKSGDLGAAVRQLDTIKLTLLRHAVEEEARLMRVIMWEFKDEASDSIAILRYHRRIVEFFERTLPSLATLPEKVGRREVEVFVKELRRHHQQEEETIFPLALKANRLYEKSHH
jgi:hemerythrin-like domain-containing protein